MTSDPSDAELRRLRAALEQADDALVRAIAERVRLARDVQAFKRGAGLTLYDAAREAEVAARAAALARREGLPAEEVAEIVRRVIALGRARDPELPAPHS